MLYKWFIIIIIHNHAICLNECTRIQGGEDDRMVHITVIAGDEISIEALVEADYRLPVVKHGFEGLSEVVTSGSNCPGSETR